MPKNQKEVTAIPEVAAFLEAEQRLRQYRAQHSQVFKPYAALLEDYNQKREAADKVVRGQGISCGPWDWYSSQTKYNAQALFEALGRDKFLKVGGIMKTVTAYDLDEQKVEGAIARGEISEPVVGTFKAIIKKYKSPKASE